ncbi:hypothetical protein, partial [Pantoea ananatis]|uniref:hypothetical protein n=1 Tax=Pantoea ananas TaxID=553 RepID=UPI001B304171
RTARTRRPWRGLTFADVLSAHPEILHPLSEWEGRPKTPRFSHWVKTNFRIASGAIKASAPLVFIFCFIRILLHAVNNRQNQPFGKTENPTGGGVPEASAALRRERRPGRRGTEAATRTAAPGTAHPDGPSGRSE